MTMIYNKYLDQIEKLQDVPKDEENIKNKVIEYRLQDKEIVVEEYIEDCLVYQNGKKP